MLDVEHGHDRRREPAHLANREVDLAEQEHEDDPDGDGSNGRGLAHEIAEVARAEEVGVGNLKGSPDQGECEQRR